MNASWDTFFFFARGKGAVVGVFLPTLNEMLTAVQRACKCSGWGSFYSTEVEDGGAARFKCVVRDVSESGCGPAASH